MPDTARTLLPAAWDVPQKFRDRLGKSVGRQRMMLEGGHLLLVLHAPPERDHDKRQGRFFWRQPDGTWSSNQLGSGIGSLLKHLDEYNSFLDQLEEQEEQAVSAKDYFEINDHLAPLLRASANLHTVLHDARKQCPDFRELIDVRDRAYTIERTAELLASGCKNGLDFQMAKQAEEQAISSHRMAIASHRLNQLAAFFLPLATLSGLFGVNMETRFEDLPGPAPFLTLTAIALLIGTVIALLLGRGDGASSGK